MNWFIDSLNRLWVWSKSKAVWILVAVGVSAAAIAALPDDKTREERILAINDILKTDGTDMSIAYMGTTTDIDLVIKSDSKNVFGFGGGVWIYSSITNISDNDQNVVCLPSFTNHDKFKFLEVQRYLEERVIEAAYQKEVISSTTLESSFVTVPEVTKTIWQPLTIEPKTYITSPDIESIQKGLHGTTQIEQFADFIESEETAYYRILISYPKSIKGDEFILECFGDRGGYGYLDPNAWTVEDDYAGYDLGNLSGHGKSDITYSKEGGTSVCSVQNTVVYDDSGTSTQALECDDPAAGGLNFESTLGTAVSSGTFFVSLRRADSDGNFNISFFATDDTLIARIAMRSDDLLKYYDGAVWIPMRAWANNIWYTIGVSFESGYGSWDGGGLHAALSQDDFYLNATPTGSTWLGPFDFETSTTDFKYFKFGASDGQDDLYWDYLSPTYSTSSASGGEPTKAVPYFWF